MDQIECALTRFREGFSCSQSIFSAFAEQFGLPVETALKIAASFGGGMGHMGEICGAITGAFMVIGLAYGHTIVEDQESKEEAYRQVNEFVNQFKARNGSIICRELIGYDMCTPEKLQRANESGVFDTICPRLVKDSAEIISVLIKNNL
jgi:C_GCAxxG_C_C family probable redox protein